MITYLSGIPNTYCAYCIRAFQSARSLIETWDGQYERGTIENPVIAWAPGRDSLARVTRKVQDGHVLMIDGNRCELFANTFVAGVAVCYNHILGIPDADWTPHNRR